MNTKIINPSKSKRFGRAQKLMTASAACALVALPVFHPGNAAAASLSDLPDMSLLLPFATFGNAYFDSNVTINGNAGISAGGNVNVMAPSGINGDLYLATGATKTGPGSVTGTTYINQNLTAAQNQVFTASTAFQNLTPNQTLGNVNVASGGVTYGSVNGIIDVIVINMLSLTTGGGNINFVGDAGDYFVLNIAGDLDMTGSAAIIGGLPGHLVVNLWDHSGNDLGVVAHVGNVINGTTLIPYDDATFHSVNGAIYSGDGLITLMSGAQINYVPFENAVPEPSTVIAGALLLLPLGASAFRILKKKAVVAREI